MRPMTARSLTRDAGVILEASDAGVERSGPNEQSPNSAGTPLELHLCSQRRRQAQRKRPQVTRPRTVAWRHSDITRLIDRSTRWLDMAPELPVFARITPPAVHAPGLFRSASKTARVKYVRILMLNMDEGRKLQSDPARLIYQRLHWINARDSRLVGIGSLAPCNNLSSASKEHSAPGARPTVEPPSTHRWSVQISWL